MAKESAIGRRGYSLFKKRPSESSGGDVRRSESEERPPMRDGIPAEHRDSNIEDRYTKEEALPLNNAESAEDRSSENEERPSKVKSIPTEPRYPNTDERYVREESQPSNKEDSTEAQSSMIEHILPKGESISTEHREKMLEARGTNIEDRGKKIDEEVLEKAIAEGAVRPKVTIWSPLATTMLRYIQMTTIRYSMSNDSRDLLEKALIEKYPEIYEAVRRRKA